MVSSPASAGLFLFCVLAGLVFLLSQFVLRCVRFFVAPQGGLGRTLSVLQTQAGYKTAVDAVQPKPQKLLATREASI